MGAGIVLQNRVQIFSSRWIVSHFWGWWLYGRPQLHWWKVSTNGWIISPFTHNFNLYEVHFIIFISWFTFSSEANKYLGAIQKIMERQLAKQQQRHAQKVFYHNSLIPFCFLILWMLHLQRYIKNIMNKLGNSLQRSCIILRICCHYML